MRHALKNASLPVVTIIGIGFALLIGRRLRSHQPGHRHPVRDARSAHPLLG
jgi:hypothetical protein